jgi:chemotaxis response regulator CheB
MTDGRSKIASTSSSFATVVFGMPREAILLNAVDQVLPLDQIPGALLQRLAGI